MNNFIKRIRNNGIRVIILSGILVLSIGFITISRDKDFLLTKNMDIFFSMIREISLFYVDETDPETLLEQGINGVLNGLDPYTTYIPESEKENYESMTTGRYGGIGALIRQVGDHVMIIEPYEGFPAQKSGLKAGDIITGIDGTSTSGLVVGEVSEMLKGRPKSSIELTIQRTGESSPINRKILREEVKINNVAWYGKISDDIGYIQFNGFTENAHKEVRDALNNLKEEQGIAKVILDVRGNPGGLLMEAVNVTNLFVEKGQEIVSTKGKVKQWDRTYKAENKPLDASIPVVVLVGRSSASAAEIVAGAIQDLDRGIILGQRTFGKGLIQTTRQLSYDAQLKITTAKYYTPSGRCIQSFDFSEDNGISSIPDSLISEFHTKNGRKVYDGGGIMPDIEIQEPRPAPIVINLYTRNLIFDYATEYASGISSIPPVSDFQISDREYHKFIDYLDSKNFDYMTQTEIQLEQLIKTAREEQYYEPAETIFEELSNKIAHDKLNDLELYKTEIKSLLRKEIVSRYYYQRGRIQASIKGDENIEKAIDVLNNEELYNSILEGTLIYAGQ